MENNLSLIQVRWSGERLGVMMVNQHRQKFFMYGEKFLDLFTNRDYFIEVKLRDRQPNVAIGYYPGQILGTVNQCGELYTIVLHVSDPFSNISFDKRTETFVHVINTLKFTFAVNELEHFTSVMEIMIRDRSQFDERLRAAEAIPLDSKNLKGPLLVPPE